MHLLLGIGLIVVYLGLVLAYAVGFGDYPAWAQTVTPFLFPAAALGMTLWARRLPGGSGHTSWKRRASLGQWHRLTSQPLPQ